MKASLGRDQVEKHPLGPNDKGVPPRLWAVQEEPDDSTRRVPTVTGHCQHPWGTFADRQPPVMGAYVGSVRLKTRLSSGDLATGLILNRGPFRGIY